MHSGQITFSSSIDDVVEELELGIRIGWVDVELDEDDESFVLDELLFDEVLIIAIIIRRENGLSYESYEILWRVYTGTFQSGF